MAASASANDLLEWCRSQEEWLREAIETLVRLESPSTDKAAVDRCGAELATRLSALGGRVTRVGVTDRGNHLRADFDGAGTRVMLLGHFDTVWPVGQLDRMPLHEADGRLYGPGIFDMKAGIGVAMLAMRALPLLALPAPPRVTMMWTTDEELGSQTSRALVEAVAADHDAVLVLEPSLPGGAMKTSRKGSGEFELTVHGMAAHAGLNPEKGASAIHELAHQILALEGLRDAERGITVNVGEIAGGSRSNVVAERAWASIDVRMLRVADAFDVEARLRGLTPRHEGTRLELRGAINRPPLERSADVVRLYQLARSAGRELGRELGEGLAGGASDGNFTAALGVPTLDGLGPQGDGAHAIHEHVVLDDLAWRAAFLAVLLSRVGRLQ